MRAIILIKCTLDQKNWKYFSNSNRRECEQGTELMLWILEGLFDRNWHIAILAIIDFSQYQRVKNRAGWSFLRIGTTEWVWSLQRTDGFNLLFYPTKPPLFLGRELSGRFSDLRDGIPWYSDPRVLFQYLFVNLNIIYNKHCGKIARKINLFQL